MKSTNDELHIFYRDYITAANSRDFDTISGIVAKNVKLNGIDVNRDQIISDFKGLVDALPDFS